MVYKVLIAEDEPVINDGIRKMIEAFAPEFEVSACAYDGEEALRLLQSENFDVVFTDIRMPGIDGLKLLQYIDENHPQIITVVISGYEIFDYAQKALKYHVFEYLLKPVPAAGMKELLLKIDRKLSERAKMQKERVYHRIFAGKNGETGGGQDGPCGCRMFLVNIGSIWCGEETEEKQEKKSIDEVEERLEEWFGDTEKKRWFWFPGRLPSEYIVIEDTEKGNGSEGGTIMRAFYEALLKGDFPVTVMEGEQSVCMNELYGEYRALRRRLSERSVFGCPMYLTGDVRTESIDYRLGTEEVNDLTLWARAGLTGLLEKKLTALLKDFEKHQLTQALLEELLLQIFQSIARGITTGNHFSQPVIDKEIRMVLSQTDTYEGLLQMLLDILYALIGKEEEKEALADMVKEYLDENYSRKITTKELSKRFGLVPSYLSMLFRQEKGLSPSDYVNYLRIRKAKELLMEDQMLTVKEVAEITGYADPLYFSRVFKKETGKTPSQFRTEADS